MNPAGNPVDRASALQGKTLVIRRQGGKVSVTPAKIKLSPEDLQLVTTGVTYSELELLPDRPVAPGDEWTPDPKLITTRFPGFYAADIRYRFEEVVAFGGHQCARLKVSMEMSGQPRTMPVPMTVKMTGETYHALDLKRPLLTTLTGPMTLKGDRDQNGILISINGEGTMSVKETYRWQKVRGQAVAVKS